MIVSLCIVLACFGGVVYLSWWAHQRQKHYAPWAVYWTRRRVVLVALCGLGFALLTAGLIAVDRYEPRPAAFATRSGTD